MNSEARHRHIAKLEEVIARGEEAQRLLDDFDKRLEAVVLPFIEEEQNETTPAEVREAPARRFSGMLQQDAIMEVLRGTDGRMTLDELMAELEGGGAYAHHGNRWSAVCPAPRRLARFRSMAGACGGPRGRETPNHTPPLFRTIRVFELTPDPARRTAYGTVSGGGFSPVYQRRFAGKKHLERLDQVPAYQGSQGGEGMAGPAPTAERSSE